MKKAVTLMILNLFVGFSIYGQTWIPSQTSWLNNSYQNTIQDPLFLLDNNEQTVGWLSMSLWSETYFKELYIDFGEIKNIDGIKFSYFFPNCLRDACSWYPGNIVNQCKGNLYYKNQADEWIRAYPDTPLNTWDYTLVCPMHDSTEFLFGGISAREWKFEMIGNYWLGGGFQTITYYQVEDIYFHTFVIDATIQVTSPNGAENWKFGDTHQITWTGNNVDNVNIEYSIDNGTTWTVIINSFTASAGSYDWLIPDTPSELCLVKVTSTIDGNIFDQSDAVFTIYKDPPPQILVTSPNGTENWKVGDTYQITWTGNNVDNVKIEYSIDNGTTWMTIINNTPALSGSYTWTVPNTPSELCLVKITSTTDATVFDMSDATFIIHIPGPEQVSIDISNAFTPNGDGFNDSFGPVTKGIGSLEMSINDRNGRLVHTIDSLNGRWDGNMPSDSAAPQGVYYYLMKAMGYDNLEYIRQGNVNLYRDLISINPNPIKSTAVLDLTGRFAGGKVISIYAASGILMRSWNTSEDAVHLDLSFLKAGMYILKAADQEQVIAIKFIKE